MDLPLTGGEWKGFSAVFDCYDRCYVNYGSEGEYWKSIPVPSFTKPEDRDILLILTNTDCIAKYRTVNRKLSQALPAEAFRALPDLKKLAGTPAEYAVFPDKEGCRILFTTGRQSTKDRFVKREYKDRILEVLTAAGCSRDTLNVLDECSFNCAAPYIHEGGSLMQRILSVDIAAFILTVRKGTVTDCRAVVRISDKTANYSGLALKPTQAYQWHITDTCDQRCRHCYLFAELVKRQQI